MDERVRRSKRLVQPAHLHRKLEDGAAAGPSIPFPDPHRSRAGRFASRFVVLLQVVVLIGAVVIPFAAFAADPQPSNDPAAAAPTIDASLRFRMDEMRARRDGWRARRHEQLRRMTPAERRRRLAPPQPHRHRQRDLNEALERVNDLHHRFGAPDIKVDP